jgi:predicted transcriptional regulator
MQESFMRTAAIPGVRVSPDLRRAAEAVLDAGETLSGFVEDAVRRSVEFRSAQKAFIARGLASGAAARKSGQYIPAAVVLGKLARRLAKARKGGAGRAGGKAGA